MTARATATHDITVRHVLDEKRKARTAIEAAIVEFSRATGFPVTSVEVTVARIEQATGPLYLIDDIDIAIDLEHQRIVSVPSVP